MLVLYVLSIGPVNWYLTKHTYFGPTITELIYSPIFTFCQSRSALGHAVLTYIQACHAILDLWSMIP